MHKIVIVEPPGRGPRLVSACLKVADVAPEYAAALCDMSVRRSTPDSRPEASFVETRMDCCSPAPVRWVEPNPMEKYDKNARPERQDSNSQGND